MNQESRIILWVKNNRWEFITILLILAIAAFLRFYKLDQYMTFLGDEGRDALVVKRILTQFDFPLLGPPTSVGNMYLGPLYYYMISVPMALFWLNPVAAAGMVALIGTSTVALVYFLAREWFGKFGATLASILYALSPVNIIYSRSSWNPDPAPFFALLVILGFYLSRKFADCRWLILSGGALAFAAQMHYLALILLPISIILWFYEKFSHHKRFFILGTVLAIFLFLFLMSPLVIFDFKYNFLNYRAFKSFFFSQNSGVSINLFSQLNNFVQIYSYNLVSRYMAGQQMLLGGLLSVLLLIPIFKIKKSWSIFALTTWLMIGLLGLTFYKNQIYDHYLGFLNPIPYLLFASLVKFLTENFQKYQKYLIAGIFVLTAILVLFNLLKNPLLLPPNHQLQRTQDLAKYIISLSGEKPFNFALISDHNYDSAYQFYLEIYNHKSAQIPFNITDQLLVICENPVCQPTTSDKYEIAGFGQTKIVFESWFEGVKVYKLAHKI